MPALKIVGLCIISAVVYGVLHDQVTARVCVEYFTIGHAPVFPTKSPTLLAFGWGTIATWWVGVLLGVPLALIARVGPRPKLSACDLWRPIAVLLVCMGVIALCAGWTGYAMARNGSIVLTEPFASRIPGARHARFLADAFAHQASYASGFIGGMIVWIRTWRKRSKA